MESGARGYSLSSTLMPLMAFNFSMASLVMALPELVLHARLGY
jgi:hypothetical protein